MARFFVLVAAFVALAVPGAALAAPVSFDVAPFERIEVGFGIAAVVNQSPQAVTADLPGSDRLRLVVKDGTLSVGLSSDRVLADAGRGPLKVSISAPLIRSITAANGAGVLAYNLTGTRVDFAAWNGASIHVDGLGANFVSARASDLGSIILRGTCGGLNARLTSLGRLDTSELVCRSASVVAKWFSRAKLLARQSVDVAASSGAYVEIGGAPHLVTITTEAATVVVDQY